MIYDLARVAQDRRRRGEIEIGGGEVLAKRNRDSPSGV